MAHKPWRIVTPHGVSWTVHFTTEEAAWGRLLSSQGLKHDTRANRAVILAQGWKVREIVTTGSEEL